jgi:hypothetical protein
MALTFADVVAPVTDLAAGDALEDWRWLVGQEARPLLLTALGNLFCQLPGGEVALLDTYACAFDVVASGREPWKESLRDADTYGEWFLPGLVAAIRDRGVLLADGQCYSPRQPLVLGGRLDPENFAATDWHVHLGILGQIGEQVSKLPPGTPIKGVTIS